MLTKTIFSAVAACSFLIGSIATDDFGRYGKISRRKQEQGRLQAQRVPKAPKIEARDYKSYRFYNKNTAPYFVHSMPDVHFDLGELYSGLIPIDERNASRALFFAFQPTIGKPVDEVTVWFNGGPGCSSLIGFFQEFGRWTWLPGTYLPVENPYSWVNETNMLWVEQPVGTGFSIGEITAKTQEEIAQDFVKWFKNFQTKFGIKRFKIYVAGESYAGRYVPYVSAAILDQKDKEHYDLHGALVYDPCIGQFDYTQQQAVAYPFLADNSNLFKFNDTYMTHLKDVDQKCGYADYRDKYYKFPASGVQPVIGPNTTDDCDIFDMIDENAFENNPCFNVYEVNSQCPLPWDVLAFPTQIFYLPEGATVYFDRADVKKALHAPLNVKWEICSSDNVFIGGRGKGPEGEGDLSADPIQKVLPQVIEATNRVLVSNGDLDMIIITNGTLLAIQNMTWNGHLGFQQKPSTPIDIRIPDLQYASVFASPDNGAAGLDGPQGIMGVQHFERGLMWAQTYLSGHEQPEFQPRVAYRHLLWLLGRVDTI